ncbi:ECF transporter S component [Candidatus Chloroploca sp. M-50]|uniref:ECF transporter S component n=1 Tax=Candidatus Chloroploca mongolica TaxID=2528176 RepID=A0ABS4DB01_9CHLR|nr:ECF transporter S component [Candidatus Chloroploca mongolica]MBP1466628.1 ECF transporter S component [Candidatus Chloroploca mongolica]
MIIGFTTVIGIIAFLYPFWLPTVATGGVGGAHAGTAPVILTTLVGLSFLALLLEAQRAAEHALLVALLGVLVAMNAILRFIDVALPLPGGFSPIFVLIILTGYLFGGSFGFLMGTMTLLVSALITGGVGPWLPFQMLTAGWVGLTAPLCRGPIQLLGGVGRYREVLVLAVFGALWGFGYGAIMNLWFWPFASGPVEQYWQTGIGFIETVRRYLTFYLATSLLWDVAGSLGNGLLIAAFGGPILRVLRRFQRRFAFVLRHVPLSEGL